MVETGFQFQQDARFDYTFLRNKIEHISITLDGTEAATAANYGVFWISPAKCVIIEAWESHTTKGTDGGSVTLQIEKLTSGTAPDAGVATLATAFNLKSTINIPVRQTPSTTISAPQIARGDRLCLKDSGVLTAVAGLCVTVAVKYSN